MSTSARASYHHGDLRAALLTTAMGMLERGEPFSLRAVARDAGVSAAAPYRHFADREALESALAAEGLRDLKADLTRDREMPTTVAELAEFGVAYVDFALRRPALFRLMFGNECDTENDDRVRAAAEIHELLAAAIIGVFPDSDPVALAVAGWALVHGLAFLHLDRKLTSSSADEVAQQVRSSFLAVFSAQGATQK
ncbi:TetR/AcrR family transcriptional regulator [Nocardioides sp. KR10-350]|uniref:TetR/AcrR family transcriptional regulator n=1 Tax=Nocardioides cheoyonin TaxID=3156615 RepID=UPI0032B3D8D2